MSFLVKLGLLLCLFASWASCFSKFLRPPEQDPGQAVDQDMTKNSHYEDGEMIPILWDTNIKKVDLYIWQFIDAQKNTTARLEDNGTSPSSDWKAQYDISNATENNEDCIYWFTLMDSKYGGTLAKSQYVNVSAPKAEETTTDSSASRETDSAPETSSKSGLSRGEIAGIAVGATIGGLLFLGGIGLLFWRRRMRRKNDAVVAELPGNYEQDQPQSERPKSELPAEPVVFPAERPRSPPRIYEAP
ncbi:uncharacterized protein FTJAE_7553 [Fusarium tjaetaba]|uniref:Mid2 domain-containing protein n=1 Tax=Fusarium tjaetaba TaxID=1567544 RepID=A0A8H5RG55_9HYPO|nr:uncharacterized protein FTJAE_7553 [Fusarium tjaetaba]KAF5632443.1 hypothetical protein FTJAE_7553 [Fusarium tjaetaba]